MERAVLLNEVQRHLELCISGPDQERNARVFWLYYRVGLSAAAISALPGIGITTKGVESIILRITKELRQRMTPSPPRGSEGSAGAGEGVLPAESF